MAEITVPLGIGSHGDSVRFVQERLNQERGTELNVDGKFGMKTSHAVLLFQKRSQLLVDGIVGAQTAAKLGFTSRRAAQPAPHLAPTAGHVAVPYSPPAGQVGTERAAEIAELAETVIEGMSGIGDAIVAAVDRVDLAPDSVKTRVRAAANLYVSAVASGLRGVAQNIDWLSRDPLGYLYGRFHTAITRFTGSLRQMLASLTRIPGIGSVAQAYINIISRIDDILPMIYSVMTGVTGTVGRWLLQIRSLLQGVAGELATVL